MLGIADDVLFVGAVTNPYPYFVHADVLALSSRWEGLPTVLIEGLGLGCPVVSTDCVAGPREILEDGRLGRLVPVGDASAMADAIVRDARQSAARRSGRHVDKYRRSTASSRDISDS